MIKKVILAVAVCVGSLGLIETESQAGDCYSRRGYSAGYSYRPSYNVAPYAYRAPRVHYNAPVYRSGFGHSGYRGVTPGFSPGFSPYSSYRYGVGPTGYGFGHSSFGRGGISIGFGF